MRRFRVTLRAAWLVAVSVLGCSDEEPGHGPLPTGNAVSGAGAGASAAGGAGQGGAGTAGDFASGGFGGEGLVPDLGELPLVDAPDTPCEPTTAAALEVYPAGSNPAPIDRLEALGAGRWLASGTTFSTGFVTFASDGSDASPTPVHIGTDFSYAASEGATVGLVGSNGSSLTYQRFDAMESTVAGPLTVAGEAPGGVLIGGGAGEALIVWVNGATLSARGVNASGAFAGAAFDLGAATVDGSVSGAVLRTGSKFAVVWTGHVGDEYATWFATASTTAVLTQPVKTISASTNHQVVAIAPLADGYGYALALTAEVPNRTAVSLVIDDEGLVLGSGYKLLGTSESYDIAVQGDGIGIVARRATGEIQFRSLDFNANPLGAWICLAGPNDDIYSRAGIDPVEGGYALVYRTADQGLALSELDAFGGPAR